MYFTDKILKFFYLNRLRPEELTNLAPHEVNQYIIYRKDISEMKPELILINCLTIET